VAAGVARAVKIELDIGERRGIHDDSLATMEPKDSLIGASRYTIM
jgi:hypothetical protein